MNRLLFFLVISLAGFEVVAQPSVSLSAPTNVTSTSFTLNGVVNNNGGNGTISRMKVGLISGVYDSAGTTPGKTADKITGSSNTNVICDFPNNNVPTILPNTIYYYRLSASNNNGYVRSSESFFRTLPSNPTGFSVVSNSITSSSVSLSWNNTNSEYRLLMKTDTFSSSPSDGTVLYEGNELSYDATDLDESTTYYFTLYARSSDETPVFSASNMTVSATTESSSLPVELSYFSYSNQLLRWETKSEKNNFGWEVEKKTGKTGDSSQNTEWTKIGFVAGKGTTTEKQAYQFPVNKNQPFIGTIQYRLKQIDSDGKFSYSNIVSVENKISSAFTLGQNYPNPFNPKTMISFELPEDSYIELKVFDLLGREIRNIATGNQKSGIYQVEFDGENLSSGVYIYQLKAGNQVVSKKMFLMK